MHSLSEAKKQQGECHVGCRVFALDDGSVRLDDGQSSVILPYPSFASQGAWCDVLLSKHASEITHIEVQSVAGLSEDWTRLQSNQRKHAKTLLAKDLARKAMRSFFEKSSYIEVDTPPLTSGTCIDEHLEPFEVVDNKRNYYLHTSPEMAMKRLLCGGLPRIFQLSYVFRREELGNHHEPTFLMLEWYQRFFSANDMMEESEALIRHIAQSLHKEGCISISPRILGKKWKRLSVKEAMAPFADSDSLNDDDFFLLWVDKVEPSFDPEEPTWITDFPIRFAALARPNPKNPNVAERFELYYRGYELCNGFGELNDPVQQKERFEKAKTLRSQKGAPQLREDSFFLEALTGGMPPAAGNALGFERLLAALFDEREISHFLTFSHYQEEL